MKLAMITPDVRAHCLLCQWNFRAPTKKRNHGELSLEDRKKILEQNILAHLRDVHDRLMLTREEEESKEEGLLGRVYYHGRRPVRER